MNKYQIGQELFWIKYVDAKPTLQSFEAGCIKQTKDGFKYGTGTPGCAWVKEQDCFDSIESAVQNAMQNLADLMANELNNFSRG